MFEKCPFSSGFLSSTTAIFSCPFTGCSWLLLSIELSVGVPDVMVNIHYLEGGVLHLLLHRGPVVEGRV